MALVAASHTRLYNIKQQFKEVGDRQGELAAEQHQGGGTQHTRSTS